MAILHDASRDLRPESRASWRAFSATPLDGRVASAYRRQVSRFGHADVCQHLGGVSAVVVERAPELPGLPPAFPEHGYIGRTERIRSLRRSLVGVLEMKGTVLDVDEPLA